MTFRSKIVFKILANSRPKTGRRSSTKRASMSHSAKPKTAKRRLNQDVEIFRAYDSPEINIRSKQKSQNLGPTTRKSLLAQRRGRELYPS